MKALLLRLFIFCGAVVCAAAQTGPVLVWNTNSTLKLQQLIGEQGTTNYNQDTDRQTGSNLLNQTYGLYRVGGTDVSSSFEYNGRINFLFGDTLYLNGGDPVAWSTTTNPLTGLLLNFYTNGSPGPSNALTVTPPGVAMAAFDVPAAGISNNSNFYIVCKTGYKAATLNSNDYSVLARFDDTSNVFYTLRTISALSNGGHFIDMSLSHYGTNILMFGLGYYRQSAVYLATVPATNWETGTGTLYFTGLTNGQPGWSSVEMNAVPLVTDNTANPTIGNVSVNYSPAVGLWLMTYDGGRHAPETPGIYFAYATAPWGPWSQPTLIFNDKRDGGSGAFIYSTNTIYNDLSLAGPVIGTNVPANTQGGSYAPYMIGRFTQVASNTLTIYFNLATWNPYTVVLMKADFTIVPQIDPATLVKTKTNFSFAWKAPSNLAYQVDYSTNLTANWTTLTNLINSTNDAFNFTDNGTNSGGFGNAKYYRLRAPQ